MACLEASRRYIPPLVGLPWRHLLWWGRWHSIKIAHLYVSPPDEFECVQITRLPCCTPQRLTRGDPAEP